MLSWLFDRSSLTARLIRHGRTSGAGAFRVELLQQAVAAPTLDERLVLNLRSRRHAIVREVRLYCGNLPMVYARTVIPLSTITGRQRMYANLGNRPLGAMLFADKSMRRDQVAVSCLQAGDYLHERTGVETGRIWGRRSVFHVGGKPLLVSEYFLPALIHAESIDQHVAG